MDSSCILKEKLYRQSVSKSVSVVAVCLQGSVLERSVYLGCLGITSILGDILAFLGGRGGEGWRWRGEGWGGGAGLQTLLLQYPQNEGDIPTHLLFQTRQLSVGRKGG